MDQKNQWYNQKFIDSLFQREFTPIVRGNSYVVRCPYCGDSSDPRKAHFYITIDMEQNTPILYNCFRCPAGGVMNKEVMEMLGMDNSELTNGIKVLNRTTERYDAKQINSEEVILNFDYQLPEIRDERKLNYIRDRLHLNFTNEDFKEMKEQAKELLKRSSVIRVIIDRNNKVIMNIPLTVGVVGVALLPIYTLVGLSAAVIGKCRIKIQNEDDGSIVDLGELNEEKLNMLKQMLVNTAKEVKDVVVDNKKDDKDITDELINEDDENLNK